MRAYVKILLHPVFCTMQAKSVCRCTHSLSYVINKCLLCTEIQYMGAVLLRLVNSKCPVLYVYEHIRNFPQLILCPVSLLVMSTYLGKKQICPWPCHEGIEGE